MKNKYCCVCNTEMVAGLSDWHSKCPKCSYECSDLKSDINNEIIHEQINEDFRKSGLRPLRTANFTKLIKSIVNNCTATGKLLDVGCAHGWFLQIAKSYGFQVLGVEPDANVYNTTSALNFPVRLGYFPDVLTAGEMFDVIIFNDVFEHIPDSKKVLSDCKLHLTESGVLVLNLPSSAGVLYRASLMLFKLGFESIFRRLWQEGLPSPHLHYFNPINMRKLLENSGFEVVESSRLSALRLRGLFTRVSYTGSYSLPVRLFIYFALVLSLPFFKIFPSDIIYLVAKKKSY